jgi:Zn-dependent protease with chaperone function
MTSLSPSKGSRWLPQCLRALEALGVIVAVIVVVSGCGLAKGGRLAQAREDIRRSEFDDGLTVEAFTTLAKLTGRSEIHVAMRTSGIVNAASVGDGYFYVTDILVKLKNPCLTWGIAAHEMGHDKYGHATTKARVGALSLLLLPAFLVPGGSLVIAAAGAAHNAYSRSQEEEADAAAAEFLTTARKPGWMHRYTLEFLRDAYGDRGGWFSTHPLTSTRISVQPQIDQQTATSLCGADRSAQILRARAMFRQWARDEAARIKAEAARKKAEQDAALKTLQCSSSAGPRSSSCPDK